MLHADFRGDQLRTVLCIGAHCDDIEIGCGGTLLELTRRHSALRFHWLILSGDDAREAESRAAARAIHGDGRAVVQVERFRGSYFNFEGAQIKDRFEALKDEVRPDLIFTHHLGDRHQDHRLLAELTWNTFRDHLILEYEIVKYEGDLGATNCYVPLDADLVERKVRLLMDCFPSQRARSWFAADVFRAHLRVRGVECNAASGYAEAFHARKMGLLASD